MVVWGVSVDTTISHTFLSAPACTACTDMVYSNALARVPTFVWLFCDDATTAKGRGCEEGTNLRLRDFAVVPLMPTRVNAPPIFFQQMTI